VEQVNWEYYDKKGDNTNAYKALTAYFVKKDSLNQKLKISTGTNAASEMARLETQKELDLLKRTRK